MFNMLGSRLISRGHLSQASKIHQTRMCLITSRHFCGRPELNNKRTSTTNTTTPTTPPTTVPTIDNNNNITNNITAANINSEAKAVAKSPDSSELSGAWKKMLKLVLDHLWPNDIGLRVRVVSAITLLIGAKVANVQIPLVFKHAIDSLNVDTSSALSVPLAILAAYGIARLGAALMNELRTAVFSQVSQKALREISTDLLAHLHKLDLEFHLSRQTGSLIRVIDRGSRGINFILNAILFNILPTALEIGLVCYILGSRFGLSYAAVTLSTLGAYTAFTFVTTQWRTKFRKQMNHFENQAGTVAVDSLINYETVKYFGHESHEVQRYDKELKGYEIAAVQTQHSLAFLNFGQAAIFSSALTGMLFMASQGVVQGSMTIGDVVMVHSLLFQLSFPLNFLGTIYRETRQSLVDMEHMWALLARNPAITDTSDAQRLTCVVQKDISRTGIRFQNVTFGYAGKKILNRVSFEIPAGARVAFVGTSGSGKSTILRLLYRFYDPQEGSIMIGDQCIADVQLRDLRKAIGVIPQDVCLFNETIRYNIGYGGNDENEMKSDEMIERAARSANIHTAIQNMPKQYNTIVGERGLKLSGGEKQRIGIARTLLKQPFILLADEATSALDSETEQRILSELRQSFGGITSVVIAHRLSTVVDADRIFVLEEGEVVEQGNHNELLAKHGKYAAMWHRQQTSSTPASSATPAAVASSLISSTK
eukprot:c3001_g1_i1.p1 GENE.c3001_g1_i1~~c3001_g1_i1.p1  ORF type:complete len:737 (-),score=183.03 c3001_g1_i1:254-2380(-)